MCNLCNLFGNNRRNCGRNRNIGTRYVDAGGRESCRCNCPCYCPCEEYNRF